MLLEAGHGVTGTHTYVLEQQDLLNEPFGYNRARRAFCLCSGSRSRKQFFLFRELLMGGIIVSFPVK